MEDIAKRVHVEPPFDEGKVVNNLPVELALVVPSTNADEEYIGDGNFQNRVEYVEKKFDQWFGGDTTTEAVGGYTWEDDDGNVHRTEEKVAVVMAGTTEQVYKSHKKDLKELIKKRQRNWKQDTIAFRIDDRTYIYPRKEYIDNEDRAKMDVLIP